jgi:predicted RNase H-like HicB family nuclease
MAQAFQVLAFQEGEVWVSICLDLDIVSQGSDWQEALAAIAEALELIENDQPGVLLDKSYSRAPEDYWKLRSEVLKEGVARKDFTGTPKRLCARLKLQPFSGLTSHWYEEILVDGVQVTHVHSDSNEGG